MGGCITQRWISHSRKSVSSLYGRVYRGFLPFLLPLPGFLPVWEGVSRLCNAGREERLFPPCMGGCIAAFPSSSPVASVSSLYGRVYRGRDLRTDESGCFLPVWEGVSDSPGSWERGFGFPPCMGGCIALTLASNTWSAVFSLYGRVYRVIRYLFMPSRSFLPVWEGVSAISRIRSVLFWFPPCMGGCIVAVRGQSSM